MQALTARPSGHLLSVSARLTRQQPFLSVQRLQRPSLSCRAEQQSKNGVDSEARTTTGSTSSLDDDALSRSEVQKLAELRKDQQRGQSQMNIVQGALEEASLITWPTPKKALLDTVLVLAIVIASGSLLFGLNVLLAEGSEVWYHRG